jgi:hypothetical protein
VLYQYHYRVSGDSMRFQRLEILPQRHFAGAKGEAEVAPGNAIFLLDGFFDLHQGRIFRASTRKLLAIQALYRDTDFIVVQSLGFV